MKQDEVIELARQAGLLVIGTADGGEAVYTWPSGITKELEAFAKLVDAKATAKAREACAKVCEAERILGIDDERAYYGELMATAIRARGQE